MRQIGRDCHLTYPYQSKNELPKVMIKEITRALRVGRTIRLAGLWRDADLMHPYGV